MAFGEPDYVELICRIDDILYPMNNGNDASQKKEESDWGCYARGALYALKSRKNCLDQVGTYPFTNNCS